VSIYDWKRSIASVTCAIDIDVDFIGMGRSRIGQHLLGEQVEFIQSGKRLANEVNQ